MIRRRFNTLGVMVTAAALVVVACSGGGSSGSPGTTATPPPQTQSPTPAPPSLPASLAPSVGPASVPPAPTEAPVVTPTSAPVVTPTPAPVATPTPSPLAGATACDHPYWPLRLGTTWTLAVGDAKSVVTVIDVQGDATAATAQSQSVSPSGSKFTNEVRCTAAEGLAYGDALFENTDGHIGTKTATIVTGAQLPPVSALVEGATFKNGYTADLDFPNYDANGKYTGQLLSQLVVEQTCTVHGPRNIKVPAGRFNGFEIDCLGSSTRKVAGDPDSKVDYNTSTYWLEGVGFSGLEGGSQVISYSIPPQP